jgi:hypothetical protein
MLWWLSLLWDFRSATSFLPLDLIALFRVHPARAVGSLRASRQALAWEPGSGRGMKLDVRVADCARITGKPEVICRRADLRHYFRLADNPGAVPPMTTKAAFAVLIRSALLTASSCLPLIQPQSLKGNRERARF